MGINGLLPLLKSIHRECNLKKFSGKTLGVDAYGWLHRGTVSCAMELAMGKPTRKFVDFAMHRVRMLQHFGVVPFLIFDGDYLPSKAATEADRSKRREDSKKAGLELLNAGKTSQAYLEFQKAVDVTPEMARQLIDDLKTSGVQYIVAPYEADAQMVYLERKGIIDGIISEDSDLLVFGAKCLLTKLDQYGNCVQINKSDFCACKEISLTGWSDADFRRMAILSGCDYLASINNMGLKTAYRMVRKHKTIERVIRMLQFDGKFKVPPGYLEAFYQAESTFLYQRVFCPVAQALVFHTNPESGTIDEEKMQYIGAYVDPKTAQGVARGDLNPMTKRTIVVPKGNMGSNKMARSVSAFQTSATASDLKKGVPIGDYFKPRRVPLAELDPNSFLLSQSQQQLLNGNNAPWVPQPVLLPRPYLNRSVSTPLQSTRPAPPPSPMNSPRTHGRTLTISESRPPKRARLCADADPVLSLAPSIELSTSRFFTSADPTLPVLKNSRRRSSKKQDINIYSDDSLNEALCDLPDVDGAVVFPKKLRVFSDVGTSHAGNQVQEEQLENQASNTGTSQDTTPSLTMSSSISSSAERPSTAEEDQRKPMATKELKERFTFNGTPQSRPNSVNVHGLDTPPSTLPRQSRIPVPVKSSTSKSFSTKASLTPLQRLAAKATNRSKLPMTPQTPSLVPTRKSPRRSLLSKNSLPFPEVATESNKQEIIEPSNPAAISLSKFKADDTTTKTKTNPIKTGPRSPIKGSEDLIIHDSEDEPLTPSPATSDNDREYNDTPAPRIDFGRFAYKA